MCSMYRKEKLEGVECCHVFLAFQQFGVNLDQPAVAMCSTGMTASFLVLGAYILGKQVPLYDVRWPHTL